MKKYLIFILAIFIQQAADAQLYISPPSGSCFLAGTPYTYSIGGITYTSGTTMHWTVSNGKFQSNNATGISGTPLPYVAIIWDDNATSGTVTLYTDNPGTSPVNLPVTVTPVLQGGAISNSTQNVNYGSVPTMLSCSASSGGSCSPTYTYQWQSTTDPATVAWADMGITTQNLTFSSAATTTMYYRRKVTMSSTVTYSNTATVNVVLPQIVVGATSPTYQLTNYYTQSPMTLTVGAPSGAPCDGGDGTGCYTYQWQVKTPSTGSWGDITGATSLSYNPGQYQPITTSYYRLVVSAPNATTGFSTVDTIDVQNSVISGPTDVWTGATVSYSYTSGHFHYYWSNNASLTGTSAGGNYQIQWTNPGTYNITLLDTASFSPLVINSYTLEVYVHTVPINPGHFLTDIQDVESGSSLTLSTYPYGATGGSCTGNFTYQWQSSTDNISFSNISSATSTSVTVTPTQKTYYRRRVLCGINYYTDTLEVTLHDYFNPGTITLGSTDSTAWNTAPAKITGSTPAGGISSDYTYQWYYSTDGSNFLPVEKDGQGIDYQPGILTVTTYYIRAASNGGITRNSNTVTVLVKIIVFDPGTLTPSMKVTNTTTSTTLSGTAATGGTSATYSYQWQQSYDETNWVNCSSGTSQNYTTGNLSRTTYYRRLVTNSQQTGFSYVNAVYNVVKIKVVPGSGGTITPTTTAQATPDASVSPVPVNDYTLSSITNAKINYVRTWDVSKPSVTTLSSAKALTSVTDAQQVTAYFDDLGRPIQTVAEDATPDQKDLVTVQNYDILGRQVQQYLPYTDNTTTGDFKTDAATKQPAFYNSLYSNTEGFYYSNTTYEKSPLNRPLKQTAPGNSWTGNNIGVRTDYAFNTSLDSVVEWTIGTTTTATPNFSNYYDPGALVSVITTDEHENKVIEYKDKEGKVILKKVQVNDTLFNGHYGWASTYYIYDVMNRLRFVLSPKATDYYYTHSWGGNSTVRSELCFQYQYDSLGRMISKLVPGGNSTYMVYDKRNRLVFTQDSSMRVNNQWLGTIYDDENRPIETGMLSYSGGYTALQASVNSNTGSYSYSSPSITGSSTPVYQTDITIASRETGRPLYQATNSVTFNSGFSSETGAVFVAETKTQVQDNFNDTMSVLDNPIPSGYTFTPLTITNYDDYSETNKTYTSANNSIVDNGASTYAYVLPTTASTMTLGMVTNTRVRILQSATDITVGKWTEKTTFYDDKYRPVQIQTTNSTGARDTIITQFTFAGLPLNTLSCEAKAGIMQQQYRILTRTTYDNTWQVSSITKQVDNSLQTTIASNTYNQLGQLITKRHGKQRNTDFSYASAALDTLDYTYNIRGWISGINRGYADPGVYTSESSAQSNRWFGMQLSYDYGFTNQQLNGNIGGTVWRNASDGAQRAYGFAYDNLNRLTKADFTQYAGSNVWDVSAGIDYSVHSISYDLNGNILTMNQMGLKLNSSTLIDSLVYGYVTSTNKLNYVTDKVNDTTSHLGDFTEITKNTSQDYSYDGNGSLIQDKNKNISSIHYNHLNLPDSIMMTGKGTIRYVYDATGTKLQKIVNDSLINKQTVTSYVGSTVYQYTHAINTNAGIDTIQYIGQEEGRMRPKNIAKTDTVFYDYFVKDHLGNIRVVLTDELQTDAYPVASLEDGTLSSEKLYYSGLDTGRVNKNTVPGYPSDTYTSPNDYIQKLNGNGPKIGSGILLKVMAGDKISVRANSWWNSTATPGTPVSPVTNIVTALLNSLPGTPGSKVLQSQLTSGILTPDVSSFLSSRDASNNSARPKAYLNVVLLDEQLNPVVTSDGNNSYFQQVNASNTFTPFSITNRKLAKSGYLYVYVSNETPNIDVFFDNLQITHIKGPLIETNDYYPFGLLQTGLNSRSAGTVENKLKYNGKELENKEFSDGTGLEWQDFGARMFDAQIGRFFKQDRYAEKYLGFSPYQYGANNPVRYIDVNGDSIYITESSPEWNGTRSTITRQINIDIKVIDLSAAPANLTKFISELKAKLEQALTGYQEQSGKNEKGGKLVFKYTAKVNVSIAKSVDQIKASDHVIALVDELVTSKPGNSYNKTGVTNLGGKVAYVSNGLLNSLFGNEVGTAVHETGHMLGLQHTWEDDIPGNDNDPDNYMSYNRNKNPSFSVEQLQEIYTNSKAGKLNQGTNTTQAVGNTVNYGVSSNVKPLNGAVSNGQRILNAVKF